MNTTEIYNYLVAKYSGAAFIDEPMTLPIRGWFFWMDLPPYAHLYIRPLYELVVDRSGLLEMLHHFLVEYSETALEAKKLSIERVIFPLFQVVTGRNYDTNHFAAFGLECLND